MDILFDGMFRFLGMAPPKVSTASGRGRSRVDAEAEGEMSIESSCRQGRRTKTMASQLDS